MAVYKHYARKALVLLVTAAVIFALVIASVASAPDTTGHWAEKTIDSWLEQGFALGYADGTFRPDAKVTRAEFTAFVNRSFGFEEYGVVDFLDIEQTDWSFLEISKAKAAGYIAGYPDGTFKPRQEISRQETAVIIAKLLGVSLEDVHLFTDIADLPEWSKEAISTVIALEIMVGYSDGTFRPDRTTSRAEAIVILDRALQVKAMQ